MKGRSELWWDSHIGPLVIMDFSFVKEHSLRPQICRWFIGRLLQVAKWLVQRNGWSSFLGKIKAIYFYYSWLDSPKYYNCLCLCCVRCLAGAKQNQFLTKKPPKPHLFSLTLHEKFFLWVHVSSFYLALDLLHAFRESIAKFRVSFKWGKLTKDLQ